MRKLALILLLLPALAGAPAAQNIDGDALLGGLVQSDRWLVDQNKQTEEFIGNVFYQNDNYTLKADYALSDRKAKTYTLKGNVFAQQDIDGILSTIKADNFFYNHAKDNGQITASPKKQVQINYETQDNFYQIYGDRITFTNKLSSFTSYGNAQAGDLNNTIYADVISYNLAAGAFEAAGGRPMLEGYTADGDFALKADSITANTLQKTYAAKGSVTGWITTAKNLTSALQENN